MAVVGAAAGSSNGQGEVQLDWGPTWRSAQGDNGLTTRSSGGQGRQSGEQEIGCFSCSSGQAGESRTHRGLTGSAHTPRGGKGGEASVSMSFRNLAAIHSRQFCLTACSQVSARKSGAGVVSRCGGREGVEFCRSAKQTHVVGMRMHVAHWRIQRRGELDAVADQRGTARSSAARIAKKEATASMTLPTGGVCTVHVVYMAQAGLSGTNGGGEKFGECTHLVHAVDSKSRTHAEPRYLSK